MKLVTIFILLFTFIQFTHSTPSIKPIEPEIDSESDFSDESYDLPTPSKPTVNENTNNTNSNSNNSTNNENKNKNENSEESEYIGEETLNANLYGMIIGLCINFIFLIFILIIIPLRMLCKCCFSKWKVCTFGTILALLGTCYLIFCAIFSNVIFQNIEITIFDFDQESYDIINRDTFDIETIVTSYSLISTILSAFGFISLSIAIIFVSIKKKPNKNVYVSSFFCILGLLCCAGACVVGYFYLRDYPYDYPNLTVEKEKNDVLTYQLAYLFYYSSCYCALGSGVMCILGLFVLIVYVIHYCCKYKRKHKHHSSSSEDYQRESCCGCCYCCSCYDFFCCSCKCCACCCSCCSCCPCSDKKKKKKSKKTKTKKTVTKIPQQNQYYNMGDYPPPQKKKQKKEYETFKLENYNVVIEIDSLSSSTSSSSSSD